MFSELLIAFFATLALILGTFLTIGIATGYLWGVFTLSIKAFSWSMMALTIGFIFIIFIIAGFLILSGWPISGSVFFVGTTPLAIMDCNGADDAD